MSNFLGSLQSCRGGFFIKAIRQPDSPQKAQRVASKVLFATDYQ